MKRTSSSDQMAVRSSIGLLQERFKQLQKVKKMRQEKQLLKKMLMQFDHHLEPCNNNKKLYFQSDINAKPTSSQVSLSLWPDINSQINYKQPSLREVEVSSHHMMSKLSWLSDTTTLVMSSPKLKHDNPHSDVDTSLHL